MPQLRDTEEGPPRTEGVVPLPREAGREGEGAQAPQGVQVLAFTFFSLAYLSAYSLTSGSTMDLSAWYQSETTFHLAPSHWAMRDQSVPRWLSQLVLTGRMILPKPSSLRRSCVRFRFSRPQRTCSEVMTLPLPYFSCAVRMASTCGMVITMLQVEAIRPAQDRKSTRLNSSHLVISY